MPRLPASKQRIGSPLWSGNTSIRLPLLTEAQVRKLAATAREALNAPENPQIIIQVAEKFGIDDSRALCELVGDLLPNRTTLVILGYEIYSDEAQDALLKLLEESGRHIRICMATTLTQPLLPTVQSRVTDASITSDMTPTTGQNKGGEGSQEKAKEMLSILSPGQITRLEGVLAGGSKLPQKWISDWQRYVKQRK